jgi:hypothetical protein
MDRRGLVRRKPAGNRLHRGLRRPSSLLITTSPRLWLVVAARSGAPARCPGPPRRRPIRRARRPRHQRPATAAGSRRQPSQANLVRQGTGQVRDPLDPRKMKHAMLMKCGHCGFYARGLAAIQVGRGCWSYRCTYLTRSFLFSWIRAAEAGRGRASTGVVTLVLCSTPEAREGTKDGDPVLGYPRILGQAWSHDAALRRQHVVY